MVSLKVEGLRLKDPSASVFIFPMSDWLLESFEAMNEEVAVVEKDAVDVQVRYLYGSNGTSLIRFGRESE